MLIQVDLSIWVGKRTHRPFVVEDLVGSLAEDTPVEVGRYNHLGRSAAVAREGSFS